MLALRAEGFAPQVAARLARGEAAGVRAAPRPGPGPGPPALERGAGGAAAAAGSAAALAAALDALDARAAHAALDHLLAARGLDLTLRDVVLPLLARIVNRWEAGELSVGQEHFASALLGGRLRALGRSFASGRGPRAVLACPPGERHELGLLCFALLLHDRGWEVTFLGADTPLDAVTETRRPHPGRPRRPGRRGARRARPGGAARRGRRAAAGPRRAGGHARDRVRGEGPAPARRRRRRRRRALGAARRRLSHRVELVEGARVRDAAGRPAPVLRRGELTRPAARRAAG